MLEQAVVKELLKFPKKHGGCPEVGAWNIGPLIAGSRGLSKACCRAAPTWSLTFDIAHSPSEDLLCKTLQAKLTKLVRAGAFFAMVAGPVCAAYKDA